jgi:phosphoserine phosphatase RsbU/P
LRALAGTHLRPAEILDRLHKLLQNDLRDGRFITLILAVLERDGTCTYANAGHAPAMFISKSGVKTMSSHRPPLGIEWEIEEDESQTTIHLECGDRILFASDGVSEAFSASGELFGEKRIATIVGNQSNVCDAIVDQLRTAMHTHTGGGNRRDDVTILCVDRIG